MTDHEPSGMAFPVWIGGEGFVIGILEECDFEGHKARKWATHWQPMVLPDPPNNQLDGK